jgi:hypothetical protein
VATAIVLGGSVGSFVDSASLALVIGGTPLGTGVEALECSPAVPEPTAENDVRQSTADPDSSALDPELTQRPGRKRRRRQPKQRSCERCLGRTSTTAGC